MSSIPSKWADQARYDLETARAMLDSGRFLYVLFCCQQAMEKMLKAIIAKQTNEFPPRLHNLMRLAATASIKLSPERAQFLREISSYYIQTRYPEELQEISSELDKRIAQDSYERTREVFKWFEQML